MYQTAGWWENSREWVKATQWLPLWSYGQVQDSAVNQMFTGTSNHNLRWVQWKKVSQQEYFLGVLTYPFIHSFDRSLRSLNIRMTWLIGPNFKTFNYFQFTYVLLFLSTNGYPRTLFKWASVMRWSERWFGRWDFSADPGLSANWLCHLRGRCISHL